MLACTNYLIGFIVLQLILIAGSQVQAACEGTEEGPGIVAEISGGETLVLDDGRAIRLIGVLGPKRASNGPASEARTAMETALSEMTLGKRVSVHTGQRKRDRYGRLLAHVMLIDENGDVKDWVQGKLVSDGFARVISFADNRLCIAELLSIEDDARQARSGLWGNGFFAVRPAMAEDLLFRLAQSYEIVEGRVVDVASLKGRTYLNFGKNWKRDFTAFIPAKAAGMFAPAQNQESSDKLADLAGKQIRVRGWLKNYNGPSITISHPEQIEIVEQDNVAPQ